MSAIFTDRELSKYSVTRALSQIVESQRMKPRGCMGQLKGFELEVHDALHDHFKAAPSAPPPTGCLIPLMALKALGASGSSGGGFLINSEFPASIVPSLHSTTVVVELGATVFEGLK